MLRFLLSKRIAVAAVLFWVGASVRADAACPSFAYCTAYAAGTVVTYNGSNYTAAYAISNTRDCSAYTPATDNWWNPGGTCGSATATYTATRTATATATSGGSTATATATRTPTATTSGGGTFSSTSWYKVVNKGNSKCVDANAAGTANGTHVQQWACNGSNAQIWRFVATDSGYYKISTSNATNQVWDVTGGSSATGNGVLIELWGSNGGTNQQWYPSSTGEAAGYYHLIARNSGRCLDNPAQSTTDGTQLEQYDCNGTVAQSWQITTTSAPGATPTPAPTATATPSSSCSYPNWVAGQQYYAGDIVKYAANGNYYKASHDNPGYDPTISTWYWDPYSCTGGATATPTSSGGGTGVGAAVSSSQFDQMFPPGGRAAAYNYTGFVNGGNAASGFCTTGDTAMKARECAAFFANSAVETGQGQYIEEVDKYGPPGQSCYCAGGGACGVGCDGSNSGTCTANANSWYYGRGWLQISWDFNYCAAGSYIGVNLINNAQVLTNDATKTTTASLWYWMTQAGGGSQSAHNCIINNAGFGCTINAINGGIECPSYHQGASNTASRDSRINFFNQFLSILGSTAVGNSSC